MKKGNTQYRHKDGFYNATALDSTILSEGVAVTKDPIAAGGYDGSGINPGEAMSLDNPCYYSKNAFCGQSIDPIPIQPDPIIKAEPLPSEPLPPGPAQPPIDIGKGTAVNLPTGSTVSIGPSAGGGNISPSGGAGGGSSNTNAAKTAAKKINWWLVAAAGLLSMAIYKTSK